MTKINYQFDIIRNLMSLQSWILRLRETRKK